MFNKLFALIESGREWEVIKEVIVSLEDMFKIFEDDRLKEGAYSAAIDAICEILQEYKTKQLEGK